jgi:hypothetical protein
LQVTAIRVYPEDRCEAGVLSSLALTSPDPCWGDCLPALNEEVVCLRFLADLRLLYISFTLEVVCRCQVFVAQLALRSRLLNDEFQRAVAAVVQGHSFTVTHANSSI